MDKNGIIGLVLIAGIIIAFSIFSRPSEEEIKEQRRIQDSLVQVEIKKSREEQAAVIQKTDSISTQIPEIKNDSILALQYGSFGKSVNDSLQFYILENEVIKLTVSNKGGRPYSVELKNYNTTDKKHVVLFDGDSTAFGLKFDNPQGRNINTSELFFKAEEKEKLISITENDSVKSLHLRLYAGDSSFIEYVYSIKHSDYLIDFEIKFNNIRELVSSSWSNVDMEWMMYAKSQEDNYKNEQTYSGITYKFKNEDTESITPTDIDKPKSEEINTQVSWVAFKQQFFASILIAKNGFESTSIKASKIEDLRHVGKYAADFSLALPKENNGSIPLSIYFGPNHYNTLKKYGQDLEDNVQIGSWIIKWINKWLIIPIFNFLNDYITNYGLIILLLTIFIKMMLFPLTYKSYLSMARMKVLKPQVDEINERIPKEKPMERQQAMMSLYKKVGVNPLGGCLPILLQMPILIAMFRFFPTSIELRQEGFLWAHDLSTYDSIYSWTTQIPLLSSFYGNHISLFTILMTITTIITMYMSNATNTSQQMPGMKTMMYMMPVMFMFVLNSFSSGLTYYYFLANVITIAQNEIFRRSIDEQKILRKINEHKAKPVKKSKFQERLEKMAKDRGMKLTK